MCVPAQVADDVRGENRASGSSVGKNSTVQSQSVSSCQYGSRTSLRFVLKIDRSPNFPASRAKTRGTRTVQQGRVR